MDILYGVKKVIIRELDPMTQLVKAGGVVCSMDTAETAELTPVLSKGTEKVLRDDDKILAIAATADLIYGYTLKFTDATFNIVAASLIEGGKINLDGDEIVGYDSPMMSEGVTMKPFLAEIYVANYEGNSIVNYVKIVLNNCKGTAPKLSFKKDFFAPEFDIDAREATKASKPIKQIFYVDALPVDDVSVPVVTLTSASPVVHANPVIAKSSEAGSFYLVTADANVDTIMELRALVSVGLGAYAPVPVADTNASIATTILSAGSYMLYAVDAAGNMSIGTAFTLS